MSLNPHLVFSQISHGQKYPPYDGVTDYFTSNQLKGNGYYGYTDGLHTVSYELLNFVGILRFQASLATDPDCPEDWFDIDCVITGNTRTPLSGIFYNNFCGNFVWVRALVTNFSAGTIKKVLYTT